MINKYKLTEKFSQRVFNLEYEIQEISRCFRTHFGRMMRVKMVSIATLKLNPGN